MRGLRIGLGLGALVALVALSGTTMAQDTPSKPEGSIPCLRERNTLRYAIREVREARNAIEMGGAALLVEIDRLTAENKSLKARLPAEEEKK